MNYCESQGSHSRREPEAEPVVLDLTWASVLPKSSVSHPPLFLFFKDDFHLLLTRMNLSPPH